MARWRELMAGPEEEIPLDEAALMIAAETNPDLDVPAQLVRLDDLAAQVGPADSDEVCRFLFETLGLQGDVQTYDDPRNSFLHEVLNRRLGVPISLSVLLMEIGRRCGLRLEGVGMPGHFLVRDPARADLLIDAFSGGRLLDHRDCARLFHAVVGSDVAFQVDLLAPVGTRTILARMLANLDHSFRRRKDRPGLQWVTRLRAAIPGQPLAEQLALADHLAGLGCNDEAAALLDELSKRPGTSDESMRALRTRARGLAAPYN